MYIGISSDILNRQYATQRQGMWCWAASIQTILRYYGIAISQDVIGPLAFKTKYDGSRTFGASSKNTCSENCCSLDNKGTGGGARLSKNPK
ncbi:MAG: hypothetical protein HYZ54_03155 [Ignavibacteriae bacterium]|nr:hypothetical protein [Ignavibacteriota bacterium]